MKPDDQQSVSPSLSEQDQHALDRLLEHGLHNNEPQNEHEQRLYDLFALLGTPVSEESHRNARADLIAVLSRRLEHQASAESRLSPADERVCDEYIESGHSMAGMSDDSRVRAEKLEAIGALITQGSPAASGREQLIQATLAGIQSHIDAEESVLKFEDRRGGFELPGRWADLVSIAAMLLLAASVILPIMSGMRSASQQQMCYDNMNQTANAFGLYTGENRDMLPMATAGFGPTWMEVGTTPEQSNSANLFTLIRNQFAQLDDLACPANPNAATGDADPNAWDWNSLEEVSYSYRIMPPGGMRATSVEQPVRVVLLADRSPVVLRISKKQAVIPEENSPNHSQSGQHMLMLDGSSKWADTPMLDSRDNIWLPRPIESAIHQVRQKYGIISGNEQPDGPTDAFVGP
ncbi:MAG: hypothetical protein R3B67_12790 [Phycisphaerales bacterium]